MADTKAAKDAADVTEVPKGLDVAVTVPGTIVGSHDLQGTDGEERTDRPGEILGSPAPSNTSDDRAAARKLEQDRSDYVTSEVDRANREELPKLGGNAADTWVAGDSSAKADKGVTTAKMAPVGTAKASK